MGEVAAAAARGRGAEDTWRERALAVGAVASAALVAAAFALIVGAVVLRGAGQVSWEFLTAQPRSAGRAGGIGPILVSTGAVLAVCMAAAVPVGLGTAVLLAEFTGEEGTFGRMIRISLDVLAGIPSIVFGLFGNALFCRALGLGFSILAGGLTLACMVLPLLIRTVEAGLRGAPAELRLSAAALGISRLSALTQLVLPVAAPSVAVGLVLAVTRALAETAALIFTSGYVDRTPRSLLDSGRTLSVHVLDLAMNVPGGDENACASALVLLVLLIGFNLVSLWMTRRFVRGRLSTR